MASASDLLCGFSTYCFLLPMDLTVAGGPSHRFPSDRQGLRNQSGEDHEAGGHPALSRVRNRLPHVGVDQNQAIRGPQVLVFGSICQGSILGTYFGPTAMCPIV